MQLSRSRVWPFGQLVTQLLPHWVVPFGQAQMPWVVLVQVEPPGQQLGPQANDGAWQLPPLLGMGADGWVVVAALPVACQAPRSPSCGPVRTPAAAAGLKTDDLIVHHELLEQRAVQVPAAKERLRALNSHAVQFLYEGCPAENVSSSECHVLTSSLEKRTEETLGSL